MATNLVLLGFIKLELTSKVIFYILRQIYKAYKAKFRKDMDLSLVSNVQQNWIIAIARFGLAARGIVFCIIGFFLIQAALQYDFSEVRGLGGSFTGTTTITLWYLAFGYSCLQYLYDNSRALSHLNIQEV